MAARNYLSDRDRSVVDGAINQILLNTDMSYPEDSLLDIVKSAIPEVRVVEKDFDDPNIRGVIYKESSQFKTPLIAIKKSLSPEMKTFALAHELGHYMLDHPGKKNFLVDEINYDGSGDAQREAMAQYFAASLLMPEGKFKWLAGVLDDYKVAKRFGVTVAAVRVRKDWLKLQ